MTRDQVNRILAAVITTLAEVPDGEAPSGIILAGLMHDGVTSDDWRGLRDILIAGKLVEPKPGHVLAITAKGRELAQKIRDSKKT
jgi:hypothetical protein